MRFVSKFFGSHVELSKFVNEKGISREQIECITTVVSGGFILFYWSIQR